MNWVAINFHHQRYPNLKNRPLLFFTSRKLSSSPPPSKSSSKISPAIIFVIVAVAFILFISGLVHLLVRRLLKKRRRPHSSTLPSSSASLPPPSGDNAGSSRRQGHTHRASDALQRQLQNLFNLHDSGLDQAAIEALPVFLYSELVGAKEPFDCAVCLCEFASDDRLRLLPECSHAFHIDCIDTWLLSSSTCPLCRGALLVPSAEDIAGYGISEGGVDEEGEGEEGEGEEEEAVDDGAGDGDGDGDNSPVVDQLTQKTNDREEEEERSPCGSTNAADEDAKEKLVFPVRLGKFRSVVTGTSGDVGGVEFDKVSDGGNVVAIGSGSSRRRSDIIGGGVMVDGRRCYSMGTYQYVEGDYVMQVALSRNCEGRKKVGANDANGGGGGGGGGGGDGGVNGASSVADDRLPGKRLFLGSKGESFSVSKIWQWRNNKKGKLPSSLDKASLEVGVLTGD